MRTMMVDVEGSAAVEPAWRQPPTDGTEAGSSPTVGNWHWPLVVDLDGTLTPVDTLVESIVKLIKHSPWNVLRLPVWLLRGRAVFKSEIASRVELDVRHLPYREAFVEYLRSERETGRRIVLATAAHESIARRVAEHLGLFDAVLATDRDRNLKGEAKLAVIRTAVGADFVYAGDSRADIPIWKAARGAVLVHVSGRTSEIVRSIVPIERHYSHVRPSFAVWVRAVRVHQWLKNLLLFVPLLTAFSFTDPSQLMRMIAAFIGFSLAASASYLVNDLWDLDNDRAHPRKRLRPFASASLPVLQGVIVAGLMLSVASCIAFAVSPAFFAMLLVYLVLTSAYSWSLKEYVLIDVIMLSLLYTLRIVAGAVVIRVETTSWLLAFSVFIFLSLALVKRCSELVSLHQIKRDSTNGRDYRVSDLAVLWPLGVGAALSSVVVFGLFISAPETRARYATPNLLWLVAVGLIYWLARLWIKTSRGEMHDDPIVYALRDRGSRFTVFLMTAATLLAHFFAWKFPT